MVLKLRLSRVSTPGGARRHKPLYNIVLAHARTARDSRPLEVLGTYDPVPALPVGAAPGARKQKDIKLDLARARYWLGVGAQPSDTVWRLMSMIGLLPPKYRATGEQEQNALKSLRYSTHKQLTPTISNSTPTTTPLAASIPRIDGQAISRAKSNISASTATAANTRTDTSTDGMT